MDLDVNQFDLWPHQVAAIDLGRRYLEDQLENAQRRSALIRMPTGTGKTGVIAVLSRLGSGRTSALVLAPATALRDQLADEIYERFWRKIGADVSGSDVLVKRFTPSTIAAALEETEGKQTVFVSTIQTLAILYRNERHRGEFSELAERINFVVFDEGHREPARVWAQAVRGLDKPMLLFTATPYRNDYAYFDIDTEYSYTLSYQEAVRDRYVRRVRFEEDNLSRDSDSFVDRLLAYYDGPFQDACGPMPETAEDADVRRSPRVVVRCGTKSDVIAVSEALIRRGRSVVAVHDKLSTSGRDHHYRNVPDPKSTPGTFWVHQWKLVEGIDSPDFRLLALYDGFASARSLVQQVGRIIRNPELLPDQTATVLARTGDGQRTYWERYQAYEEQYWPSLDSRDLVEEVLDKQPAMRYLEGNYRRRFDRTRDDVHLAFRYPCSANIFLAQEVPLPMTVAKIEEEWTQLDRTVSKTVYPDPNTAVIAYVVQRNAPILLEDYFVEVELGFSLIHREEPYVFFFDTRGTVPATLQENARRVEPSQLARLFTGPDARASSLSLLNSDVGRRNVRRRTVHAYSVADTAPMLADHGYFCSTLQGHTSNSAGQRLDRYIGFTRGRITDRVGGTLDFDNYMRWIRGVARALQDEDARPDDILERYAIPIYRLCNGEVLAGTPPGLDPHNFLPHRREDLAP